jgi:hypothetical protein
VLQKHAARLLFDPAIGTGGRQHPTCWCQRGIPNGASSAFLARASNGQGAILRGVITCQRPWVCPVCCVRIAVQRALELRTGVEWWVQEEGGLVYLMTYTFPHDAGDELQLLLGRFYRARQRFTNSRLFKRIRADYGSPGVIRSTEVTVGRGTGWHPHMHELFFARRPIDRADQEAMRSEWVKQLQVVGLVERRQVSDAMAHALDIRGGEQAAEYIAKFGREESWGVSSELTRSHAKHAAGDRFKPFGLLAASLEGDEWAAARFREFAVAFEGKRLLTWSPGLRKALNLGSEIEDADLVDPPPEYETVASITAEQLSTLHRYRKLPECLELVAACGWIEDFQSELDEWIEGLSAAPPPAATSGAIRLGRSVAYNL